MARRLLLGLLAGSVLGHAHVLAEGSPVRYYIPITPLTVLATAGAALVGWRTRSPARRTLLVGLTLTVAGAAVTGYMVGPHELISERSDNPTLASGP